MNEALESYRREMQGRIGLRHRQEIGLIDARIIGRYAVAINDADPLRFDPDHARKCGFEDVVASPNLLSAVTDWTAGSFESGLAPDGIRRDPATASLRVMRAGERLELLRPIVAGVSLIEEQVAERVEVKQGRSGPIVFVTTRHEFSDKDGVIYNRNWRTILARAEREDH